MKKLVKMVTIILALILCGACADTEPIAERKEYELQAVVTAFDIAEDVVEVEDVNGNLWGFYGTEGWLEGDAVVLTMDNMATEFVEDDEIVSVACAQA